MIRLLIKNCSSRLIKSAKKNIQLLFILIFCAIFFYLSIPYAKELLDINIWEVLPFAFLSFSIINLLGNIPRLKFDVAIIPMKIISKLSFRIYSIIRISFPSILLGIVFVLWIPVNQVILHRICVCLILNILVNIHCIIRTQFKDISSRMNYLLLLVILVLFYSNSIIATTLVTIMYTFYFILFKTFSYTGLVSFYKMFEKLFYGYLSSDSSIMSQTQDVMFNKNKSINLNLMEKEYGHRIRFFMAYEITRIINRWTQILNQICAAAIILIFIKQVSLNIYVKYIALFSVLMIGQTILSYYTQSEEKNINTGFYMRYSMKEKLLCKYIIYLFLMLCPMICFWLGFGVNLFSLCLYIYAPFQCIFIDILKVRWKKILASIPFYLLVVFIFSK